MSNLRMLVNGNATPNYLTWNSSYTKAEFVVSGIFDGAKVGLQFKDGNDDIYVYYGSSPLSIDGTGAKSIVIDIPYGQKIKPVITSAGASTSLSCTLYEIKE